MSIPIHRLLVPVGAVTAATASQPVEATLRGIAKSNQTAPFNIANEIVSWTLGAMIGLPIPQCFLVETTTGELLAYSANVSKDGRALPPVVAARVYPRAKRLAAGSVVFDVLIANNDRHSGNVAYDTGFRPPRFFLFDHSHALLGASLPVGPARFQALRDELGCEKVPPDGNRQMFLDLVDDDKALLEWVRRVETIPDWVIDDACESLARLPSQTNVDLGLAHALATWLKDRRGRIRGLIAVHRKEFPSIKTWSMDWKTIP